MISWYILNYTHPPTLPPHKSHYPGSTPLITLMQACHYLLQWWCCLGGGCNCGNRDSIINPALPPLVIPFTRAPPGWSHYVLGGWESLLLWESLPVVILALPLPNRHLFTHLFIPVPFLLAIHPPLHSGFISCMIQLPVDPTTPSDGWGNPWFVAIHS